MPSSLKSEVMAVRIRTVSAGPDVLRRWTTEADGRKGGSKGMGSKPG